MGCITKCAEACGCFIGFLAFLLGLMCFITGLAIGPTNQFLSSWLFGRMQSYALAPLLVFFLDFSPFDCALRLVQHHSFHVTMLIKIALCRISKCCCCWRLLGLASWQQSRLTVQERLREPLEIPLSPFNSGHQAVGIQPGQVVVNPLSSCPIQQI